MRMAKNFKTLREKMSPESRERSRALGREVSHRNASQ